MVLHQTPKQVATEKPEGVYFYVIHFNKEAFLKQGRFLFE
jgi:hypothetical protein